MARTKRPPLRPKPPVEFTHERKLQFLEYFRSDPDMAGRKGLCAEAVGIAGSTVSTHLKKDPEFKEMYDDVHQAWIDENLVGPALRRARDGVPKSVIGGKFRDEVIAVDRVYSDTLMLAMLKAHRPEYRDKDQAATSGTGGGVMVIPSAPPNARTWENEFGELAKGTHGQPGSEDA